MESGRLRDLGEAEDHGMQTWKLHGWITITELGSRLNKWTRKPGCMGRVEEASWQIAEKRWTQILGWLTGTGSRVDELHADAGTRGFGLVEEAQRMNGSLGGMHRTDTGWELELGRVKDASRVMNLDG